jgi:hypothetical protein
MSNISDIVKGINQAAANAYDGATDENGDAVAAGLERDKPTPITDKRVMDGFGVTFSGNTMKVSYTRELPSKDVADNKLKADIESSIEEVTKFLKKEYKKITGETLSLKKKGDLNMGNVQSTSRVRTWVQAQCEYEIQGAENTGASEERTIDSAIKSFLEMGKKAKRPENEEISAGANEK